MCAPHHAPLQSEHVAACGYPCAFWSHPTEEVIIIGVHFKPGGAFPFLGLPAGDLADSHIDLETLWGLSAGRLRERLSEARTSAQRFQLLQQALLSRLCHGVEQHYAVSAALEMFRKNQSGPRVREAAKYLKRNRPQHHPRLAQTQGKRKAWS